MRSRPTDFQPPAGVTPDVRVAADSAGQSVPIPAAATRWPGYDLLDSPKLARILLAAWSGDAATLVPACPGAGKSRLVALASAALAHRAGLRVAVAAQTREQARELAVRITALSDKSALIVSGNRARAAVTGSAAAQTVSVNRVRWSRPCGGEILIGTTARWLYVDPDLAAADVLVVDEAWQATYADMGALGALARQVVAVGDPGQIAPVVTGSTARWSVRPRVRIKRPSGAAGGTWGRDDSVRADGFLAARTGDLLSSVGTLLPAHAVYVAAARRGGDHPERSCAA